MTASGTEILQAGAKVTYLGRPATIIGWDRDAADNRCWHIAGRQGHQDCERYDIQLTDGPSIRGWSCDINTETKPATTGPATPAKRTPAPMTPIDPTSKTYYETFVGTRTRRECWGATSTDGEWGYTRTEDTGTPWIVTHLPTGRTNFSYYGSLAKARRATYSGAAMKEIESRDAEAQIDQDEEPTPAAPVVDEPQPAVEVFELGAKVLYQSQGATITYWDAPRSCRQRYQHITANGSLGNHDHDFCQHFTIQLADGGCRYVWGCELTAAPIVDEQPTTETTEEPTTETPAINVGDKVSYSDNYNTPITHTVTAVTPTGLRLDDGFGDIGWAVPTDQVTLVEAAPAPAPVVAPVPAEAPTAVASPDTITTGGSTRLLTRRPIPARTSTHMSKTAANVIVDLGYGAKVGRGRGFGKLSSTQISCLHARGYVMALVDPAKPNRIVGAVITSKGVGRAQEILSQPTRPALALISNPAPVSSHTARTSHVIAA
jgi:hypothetical protein